MTDEIKITRRIALPEPPKYEYYEIEWTTDKTGPTDHRDLFDAIELRVEMIRDLVGTPAPEISQKVSDLPSVENLPSNIIDALHNVFLDPELLVFIAPNIIKLKGYLKDKDKWNKYNGVFKDAGYTWIGAGKDSRWEK